MTTLATSVVQPGDVLLGKYRVERVLGQGGMGVVVAATHMALGGLVAVKVMLPEMLAHPEAVGRFLREARAAGRLRGEHVARVQDVGTLENGVPYMVLEYLEGHDLDRELTTRGVLGVGEAAAYVAQVCEALIEAHEEGIVHRDLKPANLFLTRRPNGSVCVKVLDFGISKDAAGGDKVQQKLTQTGTIMGSPHYMSPEQLVDSKNVDARGDVWALGIILYELVTATVPFNAETMPEIVAKVLSLPPLPPSQLRPGLPPGFDALVARATEKDRDKRFQSVREFLEALKPFVRENEVRFSLPGQGPVLASGRSEDTQNTAAWEHPTAVVPPRSTVKPALRSSGRIALIAGSIGALISGGIVALVVVQGNGRELREPADAASSGALQHPAVSSTPVDSTASPDDSTAGVKSTTTSAPTSSTTLPKVVAPQTTPGKVKKKVKGFNE